MEKEILKFSVIKEVQCILMATSAHVNVVYTVVPSYKFFKSKTQRRKLLKNEM